MDQIKIGKFIAQCRKEKGLTQMQLAEKFGITDRAVSKWENGKAMPDSSLMLELCSELEITVNDLLNGEVTEMTNYKEIYEKNLLEMVKQKEEADKRMLSLEILIGIFSIIILIAFVFTAAFVNMADWLRIVLLLVGFAVCLVGVMFALKIEQEAGYYECAHCRHRYVPTFKSVLWAPHVNRTRHMKCPECGKKSWQKKVISKE
ncbi:MAG: helix-turn-helix domain-containing protein [Clostridia bacterium]|nr:helix-turn-helix domain-containing protein [Clostridia bacterium]